MTTVTQWFGCDTPPVHVGCYEFRGKSEYFKDAPIYRAYFGLDGDWGSSDDGSVLQGLKYCPERFEWRGLAEKPE